MADALSILWCNASLSNVLSEFQLIQPSIVKKYILTCILIYLKYILFLQKALWKLTSVKNILSCRNDCHYLLQSTWSHLLKLINYSCSSYPTRAFYSGQVDGLSNPMKNELKTLPCLKRFQTRMQIFLICILIKQQKHVYLILHFTKQTLNVNYLLLTSIVMVQLLNYPKRKRPFFF